MTLPVWPSELSDFLRQPYQAQRQDSRQQRQSAGPIGWKRRFSSASRLVALAIEVDRAGKAVFDEFYERITGDGSLPFLMPDVVSDGWSLLDDGGETLLAQDGTPLLITAQWLCLFGPQMPSETLEGARFQIAFTVAVMP